METTKTTKESLFLLTRYWMQEAEVVIKKAYRSWYTTPIFKCDIDADFLTDIKHYESFRITSLRSLDEMSEEEKSHLQTLGGWNDGLTNDKTYFTTESIHYLESIGIDTMDLKDKTIFIKD